MEDFSNLLEKLNDSDYPYDVGVITRAYELAERAHEGQKRVAGEPYITHPISVAEILVDMGMDTDCVAAALLHDVVEDTDITLADVRKQFGANIAGLVDGVTKLGKIPYTSKEEEQVENLRKMFLAMARDIRVIIIKLADRLHNMRTLSSMPPQKQRDKALETMEVFAPLAHRLGMQRVKIELEDISLRYLDPIGYAEIEGDLTAKKAESLDFLGTCMQKIRELLAREKIEDFQVDGRVKSIYSIYRKMYSQNKTIDEIYDLYAIRVIVGTINECYNVLGLIHDLYKPIPGRFKDYISTPKPNMYQSLHTTVIGREGIPFEVQIRTWEMHQTAEYGIAAHWKYKDGVEKKSGFDNKVEWVRHLLEIQGTAADPEDFMRTFKIDLFSDEVFVFTPNGDLINLPSGATVIDFAYAIHSAVGNKMIGAKVNGKMVQLDYQVENGEIVEIITSNSGKGPSRDWLKIAKTSEAKNKIKQWFKKEKREENIERGREELDAALKKQNITLPADRDELLASIARRVGITGVEELYASIGYGGITVNRILPRIREECNRNIKPSADEILASIPESARPQPTKSTSDVIVEGIDNCLIKYARCCNPLPGDDIIGYITKGYGISVHRTDCVNVRSSLKAGTENDRWLRVYWNTNKAASFQASLQILASKRYGLLADITTVLANLKVQIHALNARETQDGFSVIHVTVDVRDVEHLRSVVHKLEAVESVVKIKRSAG
ncbi:RelA/SpoT family protein [Feifania hominis]|uniref:GTP diphosphokinase n=1 Tax=Feifania hominis TaxID=2763660 RepID=A0A926HVM0_9FIRM|nr:bifunctional (p)ppGpp synthetase/guanosine-3',5'-bis(diphosphate) 3'-pyrophosphohydrolase [Feifania hominis]MBC8536766.1 bifunctional (p)ppGpp synthetase/guanosine-3',5'-bis(diphosphate) 3'-pyrophosphohydrolase [Feifania hominis]